MRRMVTGPDAATAHIVTTVLWLLKARCSCLTCGESRTGFMVPVSRWDAWLAEHRDGPCRPPSDA